MAAQNTLKDTLHLNFVSPAGQHVGLTATELLAVGVPGEEVLSGYKGALCKLVDDHAERLRLGLITPGFGQSLEYGTVSDQARAALKAPRGATEQLYPMLAASIGYDRDPETGKMADDVLGVARAVTVAEEKWFALAPGIRRARLAAKVAIEEAATFEDAEAAYNAADWPSHAH